MKNEYIVRGEETAIILIDRKGTIREALISTSDFDHVDSFPGMWCYHKSGERNTGYVIGALKRRRGIFTNIRMHRYILSPPESLVVDHINGNGLDNRRSNIRITTLSGNNQNIPITRSNARSGIRGLCWYYPRQCYRATIMINRKAIHIGYFDDLEEGRKAIEEARAKNMPFSKEFRDGTESECMTS